MPCLIDRAELSKNPNPDLWRAAARGFRFRFSFTGIPNPDSGARGQVQQVRQVQQASRPRFSRFSRHPCSGSTVSAGSWFRFSRCPGSDRGGVSAWDSPTIITKEDPGRPYKWFECLLAKQFPSVDCCVNNECLGEPPARIRFTSGDCSTIQCHTIKPVIAWGPLPLIT